MYDVEKYLDNPDILQTIYLLMKHNIALCTSNDLTEEICLQLIDEEYIKDRFRTSINIASPCNKFSKLETEMLVDALFNDSYSDILESDYVKELLMDKERTRLQSSVYSIEEIDVIEHFLKKPSITEKEKELLRTYFDIMKDDSYLDIIKFEVFSGFSMDLQDQLNDFWKEDFFVYVSATSKEAED